MFKVTLIIKLKSGEIKTVIFDKVADIYADYAKNRFSLEDFTTGLEFRYPFNPSGNEKDGEVIKILEAKIENLNEED